MFNSIKEYLKKYNFIYSANARIKALINSKKLKILEDYYVKKASRLGIKYSEPIALAMARQNLTKRGIFFNSSPEKKLRIFWVGASQSQDDSGFLDGLKAFGEVVVYYDRQGNYGMSGANENQRHPGIAKTVQYNTASLWESFTRAHSEKKIDLLIGQMWADVLDVSVLKKIQELKIPVLNISMDDKLPSLWEAHMGRRMGAVGLASGVDLTLTTTKKVCLWYAVEGCAAIYWPLASDQNIFFPRDRKKYNVVFVGSNYGLRGKLVSSLKKAGVHVDAFGPGWENGPRGARECAEIFGSAKIILGTGNIGYNEDIFTIKLRDFDAPMSGALYITHRNPDLLDLFVEGKEIECYESIPECIAKVKYYLAHSDEAQTIASAGLARAKQNYSWKNRIGLTLRSIGLV